MRETEQGNKSKWLFHVSRSSAISILSPPALPKDLQEWFLTSLQERMRWEKRGDLRPKNVCLKKEEEKCIRNEFVEGDENLWNYRIIPQLRFHLSIFLQLFLVSCILFSINTERSNEREEALRVPVTMMLKKERDRREEKSNGRKAGFMKNIHTVTLLRQCKSQTRSLSVTCHDRLHPLSIPRSQESRWKRRITGMTFHPLSSQNGGREPYDSFTPE